jgi:DNA (cytosine-5)-methyltransferase 1
MRFLSVCSGMEAASVAWEPLGWKAVGFSEIEPFPCAVLKHRFPNTPNYGSLTEYQSWPLQSGSIDLLVGGTPCQSFSVAGLRKGLADPRGNLALVFLGLADKLKPRYIVWENVFGVLSSGGGRDFGSFLGALEQLGYGWAYRVLDAQYFGVPQRRRRVFVVASLGGRDVAASVLLKPESVCWHPAPRRKKGQATAADAGAGVEAGSPIAFRKSKRACSTTDNETWVEADASNTLNNFDLGDTRTTHAVVEPVAIQGTIIGRGETSGPQGTGATEGGPMFTLTKTDIHGVCHQQVYENHAQDSRITGPLDVAPTVAAKFGTGGGNVPLVNQEQIYENSRRDAIRIYEGTSPTLQSFMGTGGCNVPMVQPAMAVRRLTPVECERLQGFPDNWSQIPWKGKPADQCPDGPRYKCAGNSMAVPVMRWIGEQIARVELSLNQPTA